MDLPPGELEAIVRCNKVLRQVLRIFPVISAQRNTDTTDELSMENVEEAPLSSYSKVLTAEADYNDAIATRWIEFLVS